MSKPIISVENLGKSYLIGHDSTRNEPYHSLRDNLVKQLRSFGRKAVDMARGQQIVQGDEVEEFWALKDVSFEVKEGEVIGIIGRNGAGKSTLLKILSRITEPTEGRVTLRGRVASLLEVGTGFHPELSGRENIFLNGAILGMSRNEIRTKFDEIVDFAGVEKFLDTPVKRYSSGMYVRLAFAVAAHLDPEILVVDEVLAVGDQEFQRKCLGKMQDVAQHGRTVLFVSHNLSAIRNLCVNGIVLQNGKLVFQGTAGKSIEYYNKTTTKDYSDEKSNLNAIKQPLITAVNINYQSSNKADLNVDIHFESPWELSPPLIGIVMKSSVGLPVLGFNTWQDSKYTPKPIKNGLATLRIDTLPLHSGTYSISVFLGEKDTNYHVLHDAAIFTYIAPDSLPAGISTETVGNVRVDGHWSLQNEIN